MYEKLTKISEAATFKQIAKTRYSEEEELVVIIKVRCDRRGYPGQYLFQFPQFITSYVTQSLRRT
jgi:hypothetical protein